jgi:hypothetical protein
MIGVTAGIAEAGSEGKGEIDGADKFPFGKEEGFSAPAKLCEIVPALKDAPTADTGATPAAAPTGTLVTCAKTCAAALRSSDKTRAAFRIPL